MSTPTYIFQVRDGSIPTSEQIAEYERMWNDLMTTFEIVPVRPQRDDKLEVTLYANPEKALRHDGKLPGGDTYETYYDGQFVCIQGTHNLSNYEVILEPKQALSLLDWLLQEKANLRRLAKEQL